MKVITSQIYDFNFGKWYKMRCELQEQIAISFDIPNLQPHAVCDQKFCVDKGEEICMSSEFKDYLQSNFKVEEYFVKNLQSYQKNDLLWYLSKDLETRKFLSTSAPSTFS